MREPSRSKSSRNRRCVNAGRALVSDRVLLLDQTGSDGSSQPGGLGICGGHLIFVCGDDADRNQNGADAVALGGQPAIPPWQGRPVTQRCERPGSLGARSDRAGPRARRRRQCGGVKCLSDREREAYWAGLRTGGADPVSAHRVSSRGRVTGNRRRRSRTSPAIRLPQLSVRYR